MVGATEEWLSQGKSPVWGGLTFAVVVGVVAFLVALVAGWNAQLTAFRAAAVLFTFLAVVGFSAWVRSRRAGRIAPLIEPLGDAVISGTLVWVAFFADGDGIHSAGWVFVGVMLFAALEAYHGRRQFQARSKGMEFEGDSVLASEYQGMLRTYWMLAGLELGLASLVVFSHPLIGSNCIASRKSGARLALASLAYARGEW
jgi:hypothetical protein